MTKITIDFEDGEKREYQLDSDIDDHLKDGCAVQFSFAHPKHHEMGCAVMINTLKFGKIQKQG